MHKLFLTTLLFLGLSLSACSKKEEDKCAKALESIQNNPNASSKVIVEAYGVCDKSCAQNKGNACASADILEERLNAALKNEINLP